MANESTPKKKPRGKPFAGKGDPRNWKGGRPRKGESLAEKFRDALADSLNETGYTKLDALIDVLVNKALSGDQQALEYCFARGWGKLIDRIETNNINKNYSFDNLSMEERIQLSELLKRAGNTTVPDNNPDAI